MSRPQIGIDRLPVRRLSNEPKEAMNCKSCRKRKIKCNRLRPSCEACQVFNCECIYDAIPKKRGPKTDVLEALLKRVNGLEKRLKDENKSESAEDKDNESVVRESSGESEKSSNKQAQKTIVVEQHVPEPASATALVFPEPIQIHQQPSPTGNSALLDTFFSRIHGKPYYILDESATRQRWQNGQLPVATVNAIHAVSARYAPHLLGGYNAAVRSSEECAMRARIALDSDEPSIENLQTSLLLSTAFFQAGKGKKSYMLLSSAISMAFALGLHRELPMGLRISPVEREGRRKLFWTCYLTDRFVASGSKRPSLISDEAIGLRLPAWQPDASSVPLEGNFFSNGPNMPFTAGPGRGNQSAGSMLIEIVRVLGITNRYLAAGGVKGDSHFPWHAQSNLSRIRQDLDTWAGNTQDAFVSIEALFGQPESSTLVLSKLIYHLIHCLIYRPFLPVDLTELSGTGQHQSWQIEATNLCFLHANAIAELVEIGKASSIVDWPSFVGYCLCTAGTIHVHGAHYMGREGDVFARSAEFLSREMAQLSDLRVTWAGVQHQRETLQTVYGCHSQLVKSLASNPMRFSPVFQMEDFFDRYPGQFIDGAHVTFSDITVETLHESLPAYNGLNGAGWQWIGQPPTGGANHVLQTPGSAMNGNRSPQQSKKKRRRTNDVSTSLPQLTPALTEHKLPPLEEQLSQQQQPQPQQRPQLQQQQHPHPDLIGDPNQAVLDPLEPGDATGEGSMPSVTLSQTVFSPNFSFDPWPATLTLNPPDTGQFDNLFSMQSYDQQTPGGLSANGSTHTESDKDPFLSLLEQLAENEHSHGGPSDLDFFLSGQG